MATLKWDDKLAEQVVTELVEDFDASEHLAQEAVARFSRDDSDDLSEFSNSTDIAEHIHDTQSYWED